jgi:hypothetical protein
MRLFKAPFRRIYHNYNHNTNLQCRYNKINTIYLKFPMRLFKAPFRRIYHNYNHNTNLQCRYNKINTSYLTIPMRLFKVLEEFTIIIIITQLYSVDTTFRLKLSRNSANITVPTLTKPEKS